jgi:hypothetical protein
MNENKAMEALNRIKLHAEAIPYIGEIVYGNIELQSDITTAYTALTELAEKGKRYEKAVTIIKNRRNKLRGESTNGFQSKLNEFTVDTLDYLLMKITEAEGKGK